MFIDDERFPIESDWVIVRSVDDAIQVISERGIPNFISFDHDLGDHAKTGYDLAKHLVEIDMDEIHKIPDGFSFYVHSQNPTGKKNIESYLDNYLKVRG
jgi:hypothetical protein